MERSPIKKRIRQIVLGISIVAILITSLIAIFFMTRIRANSEASSLKQTIQNVTNIIMAKVDIADLKLGKYKDYLTRTVKKINMLYNYPENYKEHMIEPPNAKNAGILSMQRYLANTDIKLDAISREIKQLGNLEYFWQPMMEKDGNTITTVYIATKTGFMLSYDKNAELAELESDGESYFDYFDRPWYVEAKEKGRTIVSDCSQDYYGRGLTVTIATPFYKEGNFAGIVAMDILVTDIHANIIDIDIGSNAFAFLVNNNGDIIASPYVSLDQETFENINDKDNKYYELRNKIVNGAKGVDQISTGAYCAYAPIHEANWTLCIEIPEEIILAPGKEIDNEIRGMLIIYVIALFIISIIVIFVINAFSRLITYPIHVLTKDVEQISNGDLDRVAKEIGNDEITDLAKAFNKMTTSIKTYINDLTKMTAEKERIGAELNVATHIQSSMLPCTFPAFPDDKRFDIFASMTPAKEVGGDFYDFFMVDKTHLAIVVADVSGKGVPAALFMVIGKTLIKDHSNPDKALGTVFTEVNNMLCESNSEGLFITAFEAVIDLETGEMQYVNAGHEMPYIYKHGQEFNAFSMKPGFVLAGMENMKYSAGTYKLEAGDKIFQYTDGVTEATNANNELYGMDRLKKVLDLNKDKKVSDLLPLVKEDIDKFVGSAPQFDDITMLGFEWTPNK